MSQVNVEVVVIESITPHPGADRLELVQVLGTECCAPVGKFKVGETILWFPPNLLIPNPIAVKFGVDNYLKHSTYPGDVVQSKCRVAACRLRGVPSFGFIVSLEEAMQVARLPANPTPEFKLVAYPTDLKPGMVVDEYFGAYKYEPPVNVQGAPRPKGFNGDAAPDNPRFHKYTDIQAYHKYAPAMPDGEPVRITEKLHGSNVRLGLVRNDSGDFEFLAGSHRVNWKEVDAAGNTPVYWQMMSQQVMNLLTDICNEQHDVIVFGELFGPGVQDMDYGVGELTLRVFDISVDGRYLDWSETAMRCGFHTVETVPCLYEGPFSKAVLIEHTYGPTTVSPKETIKSKFKDREGCVVTPLREQVSRYLGGRLILKSVSADYLDRKNPQDNA